MGTAESVREGEIRMLVNPAAGRSQWTRRRSQVEVLARQAGATLVVTPGPDALTAEAERCVREGVRLVVACGGDGTVHRVAQAVVHTPAALGILPLGRGNDIAAGLGIPASFSAWARMLVSGRVRRIDVGRMADRYFVGIASVGLDATVNRFANRQPLPVPGRWVYPVSVMWCLPRFRPPLLNLQSERGGARDRRIMLAAVGNLPRYGGGLRITPQANPADGLLDLCLVRHCSMYRLLRTLPDAYSGRHLASRFVEYEQARWFHLDADPPQEAYADGEFVRKTPLKIEICRAGLSVLIPEASEQGIGSSPEGL